VSIGLRVNFYQNFDLGLVSFILILAIVGKIVGAGLGAYFSGLTKNESLAIGFGMNARGAMEIILATLALQAGLIDARMFVALVIMALLTSMMSGPFMKYFLDKDAIKLKHNSDFD
jgi:Kef-type K+ transport system membrane component KefB